MKKYKSKIKEANQKVSYRAKIFVDTVEDSYNDGEGEAGNSWDETFEKKDLISLLSVIEDYCNAPSRQLQYEDINNYDGATELWWTDLVNDNNYKASPAEISLWKKGQKKLWSAHYHILISKIGEFAVEKDELKGLVEFA